MNIISQVGGKVNPFMLTFVYYSDTIGVLSDTFPGKKKTPVKGPFSMYGEDYSRSCSMMITGRSFVAEP